MGPVVVAGGVALTTFVLIVLATVLADLVFVRNRVPLTVLVGPALVAVAVDLPAVALCWLALAVAVTAQRDVQADRFGLVTSLLLFVTFSLAWTWPGAEVVRPVPFLGLAAAAAVAILLLRRVEVEPVPRTDQAGVLALVLLAALR